MGLYDREYARASRGPGGFSPGRLSPAGFPRLSFTHWLIIINIAVFAIDALASARGLYLPVHYGDVLSAQADPRSKTIMYPKAPPRPAGALSPRNATVVLPIVDLSSGAKVGERAYRWMPPLTAIGHFSTARGFLQLEVWRLVTFQFLHADLTHLLFNMMGLFFFGPIVEEAVRKRRRYGAYYLVCGICGALMYMALNLAGAVFGLRLPGVLFDSVYTPLVGASAGVFGILMAAAKVAADSMMLLFFIPMRVRTGAYIMLGLALFNLLRAGQNAGGDAAHVGGAIAGFFFIRNLHLLRDFFDIFGPRRGPKTPGGRGGARSGGGPFGGPARGGGTGLGAKLFGGAAPARSRTAPQAEAARPGPDADAAVDAVLDKVRLSGLHSLNDAEREILRRATDDKRATRDRRGG
jgi:membrane associated rhomboid family serine protease